MITLAQTTEPAIVTSTMLDVHGLRIEARLNGVCRTLVSGVDLTVRPGETIGIVGESGSGKSLTARAVMGLPPHGISVTGKVSFRGRDLLAMGGRELSRLRGTEVAMVLQDPFTMLNPLQRCGVHIEEALPGRRFGRRSRAVRRAEVLRRLAEVGIGDDRIADRYPFELSGGMRQRVGIAAALVRDPDLLIADEPTTALDASTQHGILMLLKSLQEARGMGVLLITHDLRVAFSICDRIYVLYAGAMLESAPASELEREPLHPYTLGLLMSEPSIDRRGGTLRAIEGKVPAPDEVSGICPFATRCEWARPCCMSVAPLQAVGELRSSACIRLDDIRQEMGERRAARTPANTSGVRGSRSPLVEVVGLSKVFRTRGRHGHDVLALENVDLTIHAGESVGLVGESGSGKTTLARMLVGLERPSAGQVRIGALDATSATLSAAERRHLRQTVQMVFQDPYSSLNPVRTIGATLAQALRMAPVPAAHRQLDREVSTLLHTVGLPASYATRKPVALSGGERQRVAIARALAVRPRVLICDEPVSALDVSVQAQILNLLGELRRELQLSYLFITHDLAVVRQCVDRVYVLYRGAVVEVEAVDAVLDTPRHAYTQQLVGAALRLEPPHRPTGSASPYVPDGRWSEGRSR